MAAFIDFRDRVIRKLTPMEKYFKFSHDNNFNLSVYCVTVATKCPLQLEIVLTTLQHLYRKLPNLRVCVEEDEDGELFLCGMKEEKISLHWRPSPEGYEALLAEETRKHYDVKTGPLWRVTVMPALEPSTFQDGDDSLSDVYRIMFGLHHTITDGHSSIRTCGLFLRLLDSVIEGISIDDNEQFASYAGPEYHEKLVREAKTVLGTEPEVDRMMRDDYDALAAAGGSLLTKVFLQKAENGSETLTIFSELDAATTSRLMKKIKSKKLSVHSGLSSILNEVFVEMFQEAGFLKDIYHIVSYHDVNERRYWDVEADKLFGPHVNSLRILFPIRKDRHTNFWEGARMFHKVFQERVNNKQMIYMGILDAEKFPPVRKSSEMHSYKMPCLRVYTNSNMGDVTKFFLQPDGAEYSHVKAVQIRRSTSLHPYKTNNVFAVQTFRGKLMFSFDYNTRYISTDLARNIVDKVLVHLSSYAE
ncbi:Alcohol acetyltransferase/N-acetyltransferase [Trinorchestia longiramus]|nr:Alcohol acetyltransferase/N-acetyltransferase [Trinorchestia longiramus]